MHFVTWRSFKGLNSFTFYKTRCFTLMNSRRTKSWARLSWLAVRLWGCWFINSRIGIVFNNHIHSSIFGFLAVEDNNRFREVIQLDRLFPFFLLIETLVDSRLLERCCVWLWSRLQPGILVLDWCVGAKSCLSQVPGIQWSGLITK